MESEIKLIVEEVLAKARDIFDVRDVSIEIKEEPGRVITETGVGGSAPDSHTIFLYYDPNNQNLKQNLEKEIKSTITHEFHHAIRNRTFPWKQDNLLGAMITEGLADHFDIEINGGEPKPWSKALTTDELEKIGQMASLEFANTDYNHNDWFFGSASRNIPRWAGYAIGFKLVEDYLNKTNKKASKLVSEPANSFL
jgi:uncharacterized protein YjaZ